MKKITGRKKFSDLSKGQKEILQQGWLYKQYDNDKRFAEAKAARKALWVGPNLELFVACRQYRDGVVIRDTRHLARERRRFWWSTKGFVR